MWMMKSSEHKSKYDTIFLSEKLTVWLVENHINDKLSDNVTTQISEITHIYMHMHVHVKLYAWTMLTFTYMYHKNYGDILSGFLNT